jgi:hypothetical protein
MKKEQDQGAKMGENLTLPDAREQVVAETGLAQLGVIHAAILLLQIAFQPFHQIADGAIQ